MLSISSDPQRTKVRMLDASAKELCDPDQHTLLPPIPANDNAADRPWLTKPFSEDNLVAHEEPSGWQEPWREQVVESSDEAAKGKAMILAFALGAVLVLMASFFALSLPRRDHPERQAPPTSPWAGPAVKSTLVFAFLHGTRFGGSARVLDGGCSTCAGSAGIAAG
jgi:hypothetical protein